MVTCNLFINNSAIETLQKNLTPITSTTVNFKTPCDILNPDIIINYFDGLLDCNYIRLGAPFNRYYTIKNFTQIAGGGVILHCENDALMSWQANIRELECNVIRNENIGITELIDGKINFTDESDIEIFRFPNSFKSENIGDANTFNYVITLIGG